MGPRHVLAKSVEKEHNEYHKIAEGESGGIKMDLKVVQFDDFFARLLVILFIHLIAQNLVGH